MKKELKTRSKFLSLLLRHDPKDLVMDIYGWVSVESVLKKLDIDISDLKEIVDTNDKKRFKFNDDFSKIRASQGHTLHGIDLKLKVIDEPVDIYHGTAFSNLESIINVGLKRGSRNHVHWSGDLETAKNVAKRHSSEMVIFKLRIDGYLSDGNRVYLSDNGVYLTDDVDRKYLEVYKIIK
jgi:putative RNA 2'-phosphotransferase